jgi:hypothetical protein
MLSSARINRSTSSGGKTASGPCGVTSVNGDSYRRFASMTPCSVRWFTTGAPEEPERTYSPVKCIGIRKHAIMGNPDPDHISTSYVERQNSRCG